jgi:HSP20 family protein
LGLKALQEVGEEMLSKSSLRELDLPVRFSSPWGLVDELFRDGEWRRSFKVEESHDGGSIVIRAELPGVDPEKDVTVEVVGDELVIRAQRTETKRSESDHVHRSEFRYGSFTRSIPIPDGVDESKVEATYRDGILEVRLQSPGEVDVKEPHRVQIKHD